MAGTQLPRQLRDTVKLQKQLKARPESYWVKRGEKSALALFRAMARRVPAYKDFLKQHGIDPASVKNMKDFAQLPTVDKDNYLRKYTLPELCWDGKLDSEQWVISTTSGSTGEPFYFPRTDLQDAYYALTAELYLRENFQIHEKSTLYIDAFAMGAWIGGLFTYEAIKQVAEKGYPLSIITPGINKVEVINSVKKLGKLFDQVIIGCYPPIMRDIIDLGTEEGLNWSEYNLGIVFSAEGFSEEFRDYVAREGKLSNIYTSTLNHYGTVDLGTMSHETPLSILVRRQAVRDKQLFNAIFPGTSKQPTLTQFMPEQFFFESVDGRVICTSHSGLPLVRYDLKDHGGILGLHEVENLYKSHGKDLDEELRTANIHETRWNLPFVYLYERSDFSVTFSGAQIYPEEIRRALMHASVEGKVTGKFTMVSGYDDKAQNFLELNIELRKNVSESEELTDSLLNLIVKQLIEENSEYRILYGEYKEKLHPVLRLWPNEHALHFSGKGKQKWVKK